MPPRSTSTKGGAASARGRALAGAASPRVGPAGQGNLQVVLPSKILFFASLPCIMGLVVLTLPFLAS